jgi:DnaA regulatory inactivator Hda
VIEEGQLILDFDHRPAFGGEDFLVAPPNSDAVKCIDSWPDWPSSVLVLFGPAGSGKTHLSEVFQTMSRSYMVTISDLLERQPPNYLGEAPTAILENADTILNFADSSLQESMLHLHNVLYESGRHLLLTAKKPPSRWGVSLKDLSSRLNIATQVRIDAPDDNLIAAVLVKQFQDRQLKIDDDVIFFLLARMERSFEAARSIVKAMDRLALKEKRKITVPFARKVLQQYF